jgi:hypothetical protein
MCVSLCVYIYIYVQNQDKTEFHPDPARKLSANRYDIPHTSLLCVQWKTPYDRQRNCPKHVEFHSKNKFEKLVHLVGFIIGNTFILYVHLLVSLLYLISQCTFMDYLKIKINLQISWRPYRPVQCDAQYYSCITNQALMNK